MKDRTKMMKRSEELQHIIERMPGKFGYWITALVLFIITSLLTLGWFIRYHDVLTGSITINVATAPVKLVANTGGKISLISKNFGKIKENQYLALIQNAANLDDVVTLKKMLDSINISQENLLRNNYQRLKRKKLTLGDLTPKYFQFLNSLTLIVNFKQDAIYDKQIASLKKVISSYDRMLRAVISKSKYNRDHSSFFKKFLKRDSLLLSKKVISEIEFNKSELSYLESQVGISSSEVEVVQLIQQIENTANQLQQVEIEKQEKYSQLLLELVATFSELKDNVKIWEEKFVFKSPISGSVQYLKFWTEGQYIQPGEEAFTVISSNEQVYGQVELGNMGAGKVNIGQEVIIKLDNYPFMEYGSLRGKVKNVSLTTRTQKTEKGSTENYLINVELPPILKTNYGKIIDNSREIKGTAEIIANDRRLIQRFFDNLRYLTRD